jgi:REP element-mobilizing transposase RayT
MNNIESKFWKRNLPHYTYPDSTYFITFCIHCSDLSKNEQIIVLDHIKEGHKVFYDLISAIVMPDHVHLIIHPKENYLLSRIMKGIKGVSSKKLNEYRKSNNIRDKFEWQHESFDRIIRNEFELLKTLNYMCENPVKKGYTEDAENYYGWFICYDLL